MSRDNSPRTTINYQIRACDITAETTCQKSSYTTNFDGQARTLESDILLLILMFRQFLQTRKGRNAYLFRLQTRRWKLRCHASHIELPQLISM
jgi:hypothetical protein